MKIFYKNLKCTFLLILFSFLFNHVQSQQLTNVAAKQDGKKIIITYTLTGKQDVNEYEIKFFVSTNGGMNWEQLTNGINGDIGSKVTPGSLKNLIWDVLATRDKLQGDNIKFKITASYVSDLSFTDTRDGKTYKFVKIGTQTWMAENLNFYTSSGSYCYDNNKSNCDKYGRLYGWGTSKKVCPSGWHLPSDGEWKKLEIFMGISKSEFKKTSWRGTDQGKKLKSTTGWWKNENSTGTDAYGFNALAGGFVNVDGAFIGLGTCTAFWTSTEGDETGAYHRYLSYEHSEISGGETQRIYYHYVRCVKDL